MGNYCRTPPTFSCDGCIFADVVTLEKNRIGYSGHWIPYKEMSIYCKKKFHNVKYPYERCYDKLEKPFVPIDEWKK